MIELNVDDDDGNYNNGEYEDGLLFDDDNLNDVNLLLVMKTTTATTPNTFINHKKCANQYKTPSIDYENDSYEKMKIYDTNYEDYFCHVDNDKSLLIATTTNEDLRNYSLVENLNTNTTNTYSSNDNDVSSSSSSTTTCSTCSKESSLLSSFSSQLSLDSINNEQIRGKCHKIRKIKPKISSVRRKQQEETQSPTRVNQRHNRLKNKKSKHHHHHRKHRQHDYFIDDEVETSCLNLEGNVEQYFELSTRAEQSSKFNDNEDFDEEFNIDEFVQELNVNYTELILFN
jgi:hypothetical protein